jgi:signal transduction histidine kinase/ActR/RegA family two-component response regulator/HAMP domain-containing protein
MFRLQDISIKRKLTLIIMVASTVAVLLVSGGFVAYELITYRQVMTHDLSTLAEVIGNQSAAALTYDDKAAAEEILGALNAKKRIVAAGLYRDGRLFAQYSSRPAAAGLFPASPAPDGARFEPDHLVLFHEIRLKGETIGVLFLKSDLQEMHERFGRYAAIILLFMLAASAATYFLSSFLQRIISRPIFHLAETAKAVAVKKNYTVRATKHGADELGELIDGFNEMLDQIQARDAALQRVNDDLEKRIQERTRDLQQQFARISLLNQITQVISERQDTESILHVVLRQLEDHLSLDLGCVALFDEPAETLNLVALRVKNPHLTEKLDLREGAVLPLSDTGLHQCQKGQTVYVRDTLKGPMTFAEKLAGAGLRSAVAVPLLVEDKLFGVLLAARLKVDGFTSGDGEFLRMLSEHVALAAHQARLHSELERAYNELRQTQQTVMQQERLKALGQMASGIAHDVNNALSPVVGFADLMLQDEHGLTSDGKKYLKHIRTAGEDIAHIIERLREFYRRRDDRESLQELNFNALAEQIVDMTRPRWRDIPQSRGATIEMRTDLATDVPELVGIESEVREALTNLVLNAVDALPGGGTITICTRVARRNVASNLEAYSTYVMAEVSDTGVGMNAETRKRCLEPFFSTKGKHGTGLGLSMVYGVMQRHEGSIEIESEPGQGTTVRLVFPVRKLAIIDAAAKAKDAMPKPLQILYIDDEPLLRELLKEMLERDGHKVQVSDNGQTGIETFRHARQQGHPFDVVITDLGMPYVDGRQVAKVLKQESPVTPVIMLTGWGAIMKEDDTLPDQVDGVLSKPPRSKELRETLCRLTEPRKSYRH